MEKNIQLKIIKYVAQWLHVEVNQLGFESQLYLMSDLGQATSPCLSFLICRDDHYSIYLEG